MTRAERVDRVLLWVAGRLPWRRARGLRRWVEDRRVARSVAERARFWEALWQATKAESERGDR